MQSLFPSVILNHFARIPSIDLSLAAKTSISISIATFNPLPMSIRLPIRIVSKAILLIARDTTSTAHLASNARNYLAFSNKLP